MQYVSLGAVRHALGLTEGDVDIDDEGIIASIEAATAIIDEHCSGTGRLRRSFGQALGVRQYSMHWRHLDVDDIATADGIEVAFDDDGDGIFELVLSPSDFTPGPAGAVAVGRPITFIELYRSPLRGVVQVSATFGWPVLPPQVAHAALVLALRLVSQRRGPFGVAGSPDLGTPKGAGWMDDVKALLAPFVRASVVVA